MSRRNYVFTSESVSEGHPDKICDRISDAVVDAFIAQMPEARVACETMATTNRVFIAGETRGPAEIDASAIMSIARDTIRDIGYEQDGFHWRHCDINVHLHAQSPEIAQGVDAQSGKDEGAGDQGIMFGYACRETEALMPAPIHYAHRILQNIANARKSGGLNMLGPDAKSQVSVRYKDGRPVGIDSLVISTQHLDASLTSQDIRQLIEPYVRNLIPEGWISPETSWHINPTGKFVIGGPDGDCGITGRKIIVDTYGGAAPHGGGAFSGKDPTKVDRSAAYLARYMAKNIVAAGFAERCTIQLSYAIGVSQPLSLYVDLHDTGTIEASLLEKILRDLIDMSPRGIRVRLGLNRPIYSRTAAYGHFGREPEVDGGFSWERIDLVDALRKAV